MSRSCGPSTPVIARLGIGALLWWVAILTLWLGTEPWTDYAAFAVACVAVVALLEGAFAWIDGVSGRRS